MRKIDNQIRNFNWGKGDNYFYWFNEEKKIEKFYKYPLKSVIELSDASGFAIVASQLEFGYKNAFLINLDGSIRFRLDIPPVVKDVVCFHEIYYIEENLTAIIVTHQRDFACVIEPELGIYIKIYETR